MSLHPGLLIFDCLRKILESKEIEVSHGKLITKKTVGGEGILER